jgi:hypothetical protein
VAAAVRLRPPASLAAVRRLNFHAPFSRTKMSSYRPACAMAAPRSPGCTNVHRDHAVAVSPSTVITKFDSRW